MLRTVIVATALGGLVSACGEQSEKAAPSGTPPPAAAPPSSALTAPRATRKGFSVLIPSGWREESPTGGVGENEVLLRGDGLHEGLMIVRTPGAPQGVPDDAACLAVAERFSQKNGTKIVSARVIPTLHGPACQKVHTDAEMTIWSIAFAVGADETM